MRKLLIALASLVLLLGLVVLGAFLYLRSAEQPRDGSLNIAGLDAPVQVLWTEHAVPHIWAGSTRDAVFAQGFLHARDRLWQMELVRRAVAGRLAEVMGEPAVATDRFMRRLGLWDAAVASVDELSDRERGLLQAYADGVNGAIRDWDGALPPEFIALRFEPEPWEPAHTLAVAKMMSFTLAAYSESAAVASALQRLPAERVRWLFPDSPEWGETILPDLSGLPAPVDPPPLAAGLIDAFSVATASNSWVIDGSRTTSGKPILANDMHLRLQAPALWYLVALHAPASVAGHDPAGAAVDPALDVVGVSIPGSPFVITGRNRAIAWGMTNAYVDDVDIFLERIDPADPTRYLTPDGSRPFEVVADTIRVRGREAPEIFQFRRTRHGPLLEIDAGAADTAEAGPGTDEAGPDTVLALRWTAHEPTVVFRGVIGFNTATDWESFTAAIDDMDDPHQNLVYADTAGHIGYVMGGTVPVRGDRRPAPVIPKPGWTGDWDWTGSLPFDEHPRAFDPPAGFVVTANNRQVAGPLAELISQTWQQPFRAMRITEMIRSGTPPYDVESVLAMQMDLHDLYAARYVDRAIEAADAGGYPHVADALRAWDLRASSDSHAATLFYVWNETMRRGLAAGLYGGPSDYFTRASLGEVLERRAIPWEVDPDDAYRRLTRRAIRVAATVGDRPWSTANAVVHFHPLRSSRLLDRVLGLTIGPSPHYGSPTTVNVAHWAFRDPDDDFPFLTTAGPSMRQVIDMGNTEAAGGFVIPTGQSGLSLSDHYDDQVPMWRDGGLLTLPLDRQAVERLATQRLTLNPADGNDRP